MTQCRLLLPSCKGYINVGECLFMYCLPDHPGIGFTKGDKLL